MGPDCLKSFVSWPKTLLSLVSALLLICFMLNPCPYLQVGVNVERMPVFHFLFSKEKEKNLDDSVKAHEVTNSVPETSVC